MTKKPTKAGAEIQHLISVGMSGGDMAPGSASEPRPMTGDEFRDWRRRTVAELISLPVICPVRRCRRQRRCLGEEAICLTRYRQKVSERINLMMGWHVANEFDDEQDDLSW